MIRWLFSSFGVFLVLLSSPMVFASDIDTMVNRAGGSSSVADSVLPTLDEGYSAEDKTNVLIYKTINLILVVSGSIAVFILVFAGVRYTISAGDEDMMNGAKEMIKMAFLGLLVIIFAYAIVANVVDFLGVPDS